MNNRGTKMKFNKWTLGLAAVGAVSLTSVAQAEEKMNVLQTAMTSTTISGYVDTSMQWNPGPRQPRAIRRVTRSAAPARPMDSI